MSMTKRFYFIFIIFYFKKKKAPSRNIVVLGNKTKTDQSNKILLKVVHQGKNSL